MSAIIIYLQVGNVDRVLINYYLNKMVGNKNIMQTKKKGIFPIWQIVIAFFFLGGALSLIFVHIYSFAGAGLSRDPAMWGVFGDYYNLIFSIMNTAITGLLTYAVYSLQRKRDKWEHDRDLWEQHFLTLQETPSLIFFSHNGNTYKLYNMGKGTANNVIFAKQEAEKQDINKPTIKAYSIPPNCYLEIEEWTQQAHKLYAYYESVAIAGEQPKAYLTLCESDQNRQILDDGIIKFLRDNADRKPGILLGHL